MSPATKRHISYAKGYAELGLLKDAEQELAAISGTDRFLPEVLDAYVSLHMETKQWETVVKIARELVSKSPETEHGWIGWAYALRELGRIAEAKSVLLNAESLHGNTSATLHYNLGCYHCLLGEFDEARGRLRVAFAMHPPFKKAALDDSDLEAMREELEA
jgi:tetratricopeptide (TPR) repeat protein